MLKELTKNDLDLVLGDIKTLDSNGAIVVINSGDNWILGITCGTKGYRPIPADSCSIPMSDIGAYDEMYEYATKLNTEHLNLSELGAATIIGASMGII